VILFKFDYCGGGGGSQIEPSVVYRESSLVDAGKPPENLPMSGDTIEISGVDNVGACYTFIGITELPETLVPAISWNECGCI